MFENGRCAFGQTGAAQSHLQNNDVGIGDLFLFFGLFSDPFGENRHHRIFGYLKIEQVSYLGKRAGENQSPAGFSIRHPHSIGDWNANNCIYVGTGNTAKKAKEVFRLTEKNASSVSNWSVPSWLKHVGLTYHHKPNRWSENTLRAVSRGQEFVADLSSSQEGRDWVYNIVDTIELTNVDLSETMDFNEVIVVFLRRPNLLDPNEMRSDPFWEFGSFGITGCHHRNLMNPAKSDELVGKRLAFVQGGHAEIRLVLVTPPVEVKTHGSCIEATWNSSALPLTFKSAPLVVNNLGETDIPGFLDELEFVNRSTPVAKFASKFRSRRRPLDTELGLETIQTFNQFRSRISTRTVRYTDALPYLPPKVDENRASTYDELKRIKNPWTSKTCTNSTLRADLIDP